MLRDKSLQGHTRDRRLEFEQKRTLEFDVRRCRIAILLRYR